ncbi:hypothetical protein [Actomonas aquatica]|uniref:Uncharacterized protein n=1 Tax=Actomonas aquatica TaxID=2866162 RepID=A0ABZ1C6W5_9BACT|nr:hypothetical protein [Opitutus sp. WL0086]WRQ87196.1 hypothetical protein K1X11_020480 [Opitutus sp. WL0086]
MHIPKIKTVQAEGEGILITESSPRELGEPELLKGGGEFCERHAGTDEAGLRGDDRPSVRFGGKQSDEENVVTEELVLPDETMELVERKGIVEVRGAVFGPTHRIAAAGGFGVFDPTPTGFVDGNVVLPTALSFGTGEA